jgi:hypothetical protein
LSPFDLSRPPVPPGGLAGKAGTEFGEMPFSMIVYFQITGRI